MTANNSAAIREALEDSQLLLESFSRGELGAQVREQMRDNQAALAAPPRNCDRFATVKEAAIAFAAEVKNQPHPCPDFTFSTWLLSPVTEKEGGSK